MTEHDLQPGDSVQVDGRVYGVLDADAWMVTLRDERGQIYRVEHTQVERTLSATEIAR